MIFSESNKVCPYVFAGLSESKRSKIIGIKPGVIIRCVTNITGITEDQIVGKSRKEGVSRCRIMCAGLMRKYSKLSLHKIAAVLKRDHSTIVYQIKTFSDRFETDKEFYLDVTKIEYLIENL